MIKITIPKEKIKENYNLIVSNIILNQKNKFTFDEIMEISCNEIGCKPKEIEATVKKALLRMREDGFLSVLGSKYEVIEVSI